MQLELEPYIPRKINFLELYKQGGWNLKVYSILYPDKTLNPQLVETAKKTALEFLPDATEPGHYSAGFISVHQGKSYDFVTVAYWTYSTELKHQTYMKASSASAALELTTELSSDVWDLHLLALERDAWVSEVLSASTPSVEMYLAQQVSETV
ncbi:MAG: isochorismatase [Trueperaceae bacterium]